MAFEVVGEIVDLASSKIGIVDSTNILCIVKKQEETVVALEQHNSTPLPITTNCFRKTITDLPPALVSEILHYLDPKELGIVSCVSTTLQKVASEHQGWKRFYFQRWGCPPLSLDEKRSWKDVFVEREFRSNSFMGRYSIDVLYGHTEAIRSVFLLSCANIVVTAGYDSVIRMWDMENGLSLASSRPLGCTIRAVTADVELLVVGGSDGFLHCWRAVEGLTYLFNITGVQEQSSEFRLWEHQGPVTCIALDSSWIYSGSWDMTIRIWDRASFKCSKVLMHKDWVWSLAPRGSTVASTAGGDMYVWDVENGNLLGAAQHGNGGNTYSLSRSCTGDLLFTGGEDGTILMFEITDHSTIDFNVLHVATWTPHTAAVHSLAFEFPWLVSASVDGKISLIDIRKLLKSRKHSMSKDLTSKGNRSTQPSMEAPQRMLNGFRSNLFSIDIGADRIVCAGEEGVVRIWNFSKALEIDQRVKALKSIRLENRMRRRKVQIEMNAKGGRADQCSLAAKKNQINGDRNGAWHGRRPVSGKVKT